MAAKIAVPGFEPGWQVCDDALRLPGFRFLLCKWLEQWGSVRRQKQLVEIHILTSTNLSADP